MSVLLNSASTIVVRMPAELSMVVLRMFGRTMSFRELMTGLPDIMTTPERRLLLSIC